VRVVIEHIMTTTQIKLIQKLVAESPDDIIITQNEEEDRVLNDLSEVLNEKIHGSFPTVIIRYYGTRSDKGELYPA
jgi:hypothetical protein